MQELPSLNADDDEHTPLIVAVPAAAAAAGDVPPSKARRLLSKLARPLVGFWEFLVTGNFVQLATAVIVGVLPPPPGSVLAASFSSAFFFQGALLTMPCAA